MADNIGPADNGKGYPFYVDQKSPGDGILAKDHNHLVNAVNRANTGINGVRNISGANDADVFLRLLQIQVVDVDSLTCAYVDGETDRTFVEVAKPFQLRGTLASHGDVTFVSVSASERTASATGETDETQVVVPSYEVDDFIIAIRDVTGGTELLDEDGTAIQWIDLNIDARAWAKQAA